MMRIRRIGKFPFPKTAHAIPGAETGLRATTVHVREPGTHGSRPDREHQPAIHPAHRPGKGGGSCGIRSKA